MAAGEPGARGPRRTAWRRVSRAATGRLGALYGGPILLLAFGGAFVRLDWAMLRGVARFRRGWRNGAIAFSALVGLAGITLVVGDRASWVASSD